MVTRRRFSKDAHREKLSKRENLEAILLSSTEKALRENDPTIHKPAVRIAAQLVSIIASQIAAQTQVTQRSFRAIEEDIADYGTDFVDQLIDEAQRRIGGKLSKFRAALPKDDPDHKLQLADDWAGPVAGPTIIERHYGIPRSTLYRWQKLNEAVAIGTRTSSKPVFPLKQFVNGRPVTGLSQIISTFGSQEVAWKWLMRSHPQLENKKGIDALLEGNSETVIHLVEAQKIAKDASANN